MESATGIGDGVWERWRRPFVRTRRVNGLCVATIQQGNEAQLKLFFQSKTGTSGGVWMYFYQSRCKHIVFLGISASLHFADLSYEERLRFPSRLMMNNNGQLFTTWNFQPNGRNVWENAPKKPISVCFRSRYHWTSINQDEQLVTQILQLGAIKALQKRAQQHDVIKGAPVELQTGEQCRKLRKYVICWRSAAVWSPHTNLMFPSILWMFKS